MECFTVYGLYMSTEDYDYRYVETEEPITGESERKLASCIIKMLPWEKTSLDHAYCTTTVWHCMQEPCQSQDKLVDI